MAALLEALPRALEQALTAQSQQMQQQTAFLREMSQLNLRSAARVMGSKGGRRTQENRLRRTGCALCIDPMMARPTIAMIEAHRLHPRVLPRTSSAGDAEASQDGSGAPAPGTT